MVADVVPGALQRLIAIRYHVSLGVATPILGGGDECLLWRVAAPRPLVVRVSAPRRRRADLAWAFTAAVAFARQLPEAISPLSTVDGAYVVDWDGAPVSLWPYIPGEHLNRERPDARAQAARLLARLHQTARRLPTTPTRPAGQPADAVSTVSLDDVADPDLDRLMDRWRTGGALAWPGGIVHGDFYRRNLLWHDGRITGLIDWDDARLDRFVTELAWATWELAKNPAGDRIQPDRAAAFLATYRAAGGPAFPHDMIGPLIRYQLREEIRRSRTAALTGGHHDPAYEAAEVRAFGTVEDDLR
jgi:Ser/Thr protein kinase RdoA (MazF antagonist)